MMNTCVGRCGEGGCDCGTEGEGTWRGGGGVVADPAWLHSACGGSRPGNTVYDTCRLHDWQDAS